MRSKKRRRGGRGGQWTGGQSERQHPASRERVPNSNPFSKTLRNVSLITVFFPHLACCLRSAAVPPSRGSVWVYWGDVVVWVLTILHHPSPSSSGLWCFFPHLAYCLKGADEQELCPLEGDCEDILWGGCCGMSFDHTTQTLSFEPWTLVFFPIRPISWWAQWSDSYAPLKEQCEGILGGCCGMSFD
jgi:hypothetical protein